MEQKAKALIVDDDPNILRSMRAILHSRRKQWKVHFATGGKEAQRMMQEEQYQLIVSDVRMPEVDGCEVLQDAKETQPEAIRVLLSGETGHNLPGCMIGLAHQLLCKPCGTETLWALFDQIEELNASVPDSNLRKQLITLSDLPANSDLYGQISQEFFADSPSIRKIGHLVQQDMALTSLVLRVVNSPFFGTAYRITSVENAVSYLGLDTVQGLLLGHSTYSQVHGHTKTNRTIQQLWNRSLRTADLARAIANHEHLAPETQSDVYVAAIMNDIGKVALFWTAEEQYGDITRQAAENTASLCSLELEQYQCTHAEVGFYLLGLWGLDRKVMQGVLHSHRLPETFATSSMPGQASGQPLDQQSEQALPIAAIVHVANALAATQTSNEAYDQQPAIDFEWFARRGWETKLDEWQELNHTDGQNA